MTDVAMTILGGRTAKPSQFRDWAPNFFHLRVQSFLLNYYYSYF